MKKKKNLSERLPASNFISLWGLLYAITAGLGTLLYIIVPEASISTLYLAAVFSLLPTILTYIGQGFLLKFQFGWSARNWIIASSIGMVLIIFLNMGQTILLGNFTSLAVAWVFRRIPLLTLGLAQYVVLRQYVRRSWLWVLAMLGISIANLPLYSLLFNAFGTTFSLTTIGSAILMAFLGGIQGIILGVAMTLLVRLSIKDEHKLMEEDSEADAHINRLTDNTPQDIEEDLAKLSHRVSKG